MYHELTKLTGKILGRFNPFFMAVEIKLKSHNFLNACNWWFDLKYIYRIIMSI